MVFSASCGSWGWGLVGGAPHTHTHAHACTHVHPRTCMHGKHGNFIQMAAPIGFGEIPGIPYDVICAYIHARACAHGWGAPFHHPHPHPPTPQGGPPESFKIQ